MFQSVIVKSIERNAPNMYDARRRLLGLSGEVTAPVSCSNTSDVTSSTTAPSNTTTTNSLGLAGLGGFISNRYCIICNMKTIFIRTIKRPLCRPPTVGVTKNPVSCKSLLHENYNRLGPVLFAEPPLLLDVLNQILNHFTSILRQQMAKYLVFRLHFICCL